MYVQQLIQMVSGLGLGLGIRPQLVATSNVFRSEEFTLHLGGLRDSFDCVQVGKDDWGDSFPTLDRVAKLIVAEKTFASADRILFPTADGLAQRLGSLSRYPGQKLSPLLARSKAALLGGRQGYPVPIVRRIHNRLSRWALHSSNWKTLFHIDPYQQEYLSRKEPGRWRLLPDPVGVPPQRSVADARRQLGLPEQGICLGNTGVIERSKGCDLLVEAFAGSIDQFPAGSYLLLAGKFVNGLYKEFSSRYRNLVETGRLFLLNGQLSPDDFWAAIQSMNVVCLPYLRAWQSSGVFMHAVAAGKPVIATDAGWLRRSVRLLDQGWLAEIGDPGLFAGSLVEAVRSLDNRGFVAGERSRRFLEFHSYENFRSTWSVEMRKELGLAADPGLKTWNHVLE